MDILISVVGIFVLLGIAVLFSNNRNFMYRRDVVRYKRLLILSVKSLASVTKGLVSYSVD